MAAGLHVNVSEDRAALHTVLRAPGEASLIVDGTDVVAESYATADRVSDYVE
jgi:glucose-6-phosphate isomerase